jgi:hypothetical protein
MLLRLVGCFVLIVTAAHAQWQRYVSGDGKGESFDSPPPHALKYFLTDPCLRPKSDEVVAAFECMDPTPQDRKHWAGTRTELVGVGRIANFKIFDMWYRRDGYRYPYFDIRSVLVKTSADEYREINVQARFGEYFPASEIAKLDGEPVLIAKSHFGGHSPFHQTYYLFRESGAIVPDFRDVHDAVAKLMPPDMRGRDIKDELGSYIEEIWNQYRQEPLFPLDGAKIIVTYRFVDGRAVVTDSKLVLPLNLVH